MRHRRRPSGSGRAGTALAVAALALIVFLGVSYRPPAGIEEIDVGVAGGSVAGSLVGSSEQQAMAGIDVSPASGSVEVFTLPPEDTFYGILEKPLFSPSRLPPDAPVEQVETAGSLAHLTLVGIMTSPDSRVALLEQPQSEERFLQVTEGDSILGWTVTAIEKNRILFAAGPERHELRLVEGVSGAEMNMIGKE